MREYWGCCAAYEHEIRGGDMVGGGVECGLERVDDEASESQYAPSGRARRSEEGAVVVISGGRCSAVQCRQSSTARVGRRILRAPAVEVWQSDVPTTSAFRPRLRGLETA